MSEARATRAETLHWWVVAGVALAIVAPVLVGGALVIQIAVVIFGVVAFFRLRQRRSRVIVVIAVSALSLIVAGQIAGMVAVTSLDATFTDDSVDLSR
ncbi:MAG: hypothetical protein PIR02_11560 [Microbacterium enclense]